MTASMLRAATTNPTATTPVLVEIELDGERRPIAGWRLEGSAGDPDADPPKPATDFVLILELGQYEEVLD